MLFVFIADTHFDSAFSGENSNLRNSELISAFRDSVEYAKAIGTIAVLLGGDLFDSPYPCAETAGAVRSIIASSSELQFIAICGNHDPIHKTAFYDSLPKNFYLFPDSITRYDFEGITFYGVSEKESSYSDNRWEGFRADGRFITLSHGDLYPATLAQTGAALCLLGHIHKSEVHVLSNGVSAIYSGCLAGRGFDECGAKGFYVIDSDDMSYRFIRSGAKEYAEYKVDVSETSSVEELMELLQDIVPGEKEIARAVLTGGIKEPYTIDCEKLAALFPQFAEIRDKSFVDRDVMSGINESTLEGEFIRILNAKYENADEDEKPKILEAMKQGVLALRRK